MLRQDKRGKNLFNSQDDEKTGVDVCLKLTSGEDIRGKVSGGMTGKIADALNKPDPFINLLRPDGTSVLIAKAVVAQIETVEKPRTDQLKRKMSKESSEDPYVVLGIGRTASLPDIQSAYHALARKYHPDHFSGREIPSEVLQYVSGMFQRITIAYNELKDTGETSDAA